MSNYKMTQDDLLRQVRAASECYERANVAQIYSLLREKLASCTTESEAVSFAVDSLASLGLGRVRYYEVAVDSRTEKATLVLRQMAGAPDLRGLLGYEIPESSATIFDKRNWRQPAYGEGPTDLCDPQKRKWIEHLGLENRSWWDLPITVANEKHALLGIDFPLRNPAFGKEEIWLVWELSQQLGLTIDFLSRGELVACEARIHHALSSAATLGSLLETATGAIRDMLCAASISYFALDTVENRLVKRASAYVHTGELSEKKDFSESYAPGVCLTGRAWTSAHFRLTADFRALYNEEPELVNAESLDYHAALVQRIGNGHSEGIRTVLYSTPGEGEFPGMFRAINRADDVRMPFTRYHREMLEGISDAVNSALGQCARKKVMLKVGEAVAALQKTPEQYPATLESIREVTSVYGVESVGVLLKDPLSDKVRHYAFAGTPLDEIRLPKDSTWSKDQFLGRMTREDEAFLVNPTDLVAASPFCGALCAIKVLQIMVVPFVGNSEAPGALFVVTRRGEVASAPNECRRDSLMWNTLTMLGASFGNSLEIAKKSIRVASARRIFASIGHEFRTPAQILASQAEVACDIAKSLAERHNHLRLPQVHCCFEEIEKQTEEIQKAIVKAFSIGRDDVSVVQLDMTVASLGNTINRCHGLLRADCVQRRVQINVHDSVHRIPELIADFSGLERVFMNLLENAAKYSNPRNSGGPSVVDVRGEYSERFAIVKIVNWGMGIPEEDYEAIFRGFYRSPIRDERRVVVGMGIGLSIVHRIVSEHGGEISVTSKPTLDDPVRRQKLEGYLTTFTVKLPRDLKPGIRDIRKVKS